MGKNKVIIKLKGGLGNQMFQYAFAKSFALKNKCDLYLNIYTGFIFDYQFKRKYELNNLHLNEKKASIYLLFIYYLSKLDFKLKKRDNSIYFMRRSYASFLYELDHIYNPDYQNIKFNGILFIDGYWQSPKYFNEFELIIKNDFNINQNFSQIIIDLASKISNENSIALCLRLYEEVNNPGTLSSTGFQKSTSEINEQLTKVLKSTQDSNVYFFCTHKPNFLSDLLLPKNTTFITADNSFNNTIETLYLLKQCKKFIIMNSSFYWWGAYLSDTQNEESAIHVDSNFLNQDIYLDNWVKF